jgi:hypothetical protein
MRGRPIACLAAATLLGAACSSSPEGDGGAATLLVDAGPATPSVQDSGGPSAQDSGLPVDAAKDASPDTLPPTDSGTPCAITATDSAPKASSYPATLGAQQGWIHDEGSPAGYFHTFDALAVGGTPRKVHVFLPRSYPTSHAAPCRRYPVVYMHDGNTAFFPGGPAGKTWDVQAVLAKAYASGSLPEVIVVAVHPIDRNSEYTHASWFPGKTCCGVGTYTEYLASKLKPFIDGAYRTLPSAKHTTIVGSSHGGLAAFYAAASRPDVFGSAVAMSSSFWAGLDPTSGTLPGSALLTQVGASLKTGHPRLYLDWGLVRTGGEHNAVIEAAATTRGEEMVALLQAQYGYTLGTDLRRVIDPTGEHEEVSWGRRLGAALTGAVSPP